MTVIIDRNNSQIIILIGMTVRKVGTVVTVWTEEAVVTVVAEVTEVTVVTVVIDVILRIPLKVTTVQQERQKWKLRK